MNWLLIVLLCISFSISATELSDLIDSRTEFVIVADKTSGKLFVFNPISQTVIATPALYGKVISDVYNKSDYNFGGKPKQVTPAGEFRSMKYYSKQLHEPITAIIQGTESFIAIHPVWLGNPEQHRAERLNTPSGNDNRITNGCINIPSDFYFEVIDKIKNNTKVVVLPEGHILNDNVTGTYTPAHTYENRPDLSGQSGLSGL